MHLAHTVLLVSHTHNHGTAQHTGARQTVKGRPDSPPSLHVSVVCFTGSFSWLESAIVEWQQGQLQQQQQQQLQQQQQQLRTGGSAGARGGAGGYSPQQVEEVKMVLRLLPVFAVTVIYW